MEIKKHIPNFITILNLVCGVFAIFFFINSLWVQPETNSTLNPKTIAINQGIFLIFLAAVLDFLDGFVARILKVQSDIGAQLDSLADMITFGVAPGFLFLAFCTLNFPENNWAQFIFVIIPVFSAIRLAKFNVNIEQTDYFKGIATPANAIFWIGISAFSFRNFEYTLIFEISIIALAILMSLLMVSDFRMFSLKLKNLELKGDNIYRVLLILGAIILTISFGLFTNILAAIPFIILLYILLSLNYHYSTRNTK